MVTCGLRLVWEKVLERAGLGKIKVIGGGGVENGYVVTGAAKGAVVQRLRDHHGISVAAFRDSPLDLAMMKEVDQAFVVVGNEEACSSTMPAALQAAIRSGLNAKQLLLPVTATPLLDSDKLPLVTDIKSEIVNMPHLRLIHATDTPVAQLLATPTRDSNVQGIALRHAHGRVGWYLSVHYLSEITGLDRVDVPHVQGGHADGYRLRNEKLTTIVALMRGGEPIAQGVNKALPKAMLVHAKKPEDLTGDHLKGQTEVVLADFVVNTGAEIVRFVRRIRELSSTICIVVVAGVVQAEAVQRGGQLPKLAREAGTFSIVALRLSNNKFKGLKETDTGNRLFGTTHMD